MDPRIYSVLASWLLFVLYLDSAMEWSGFLLGTDRRQGLCLILNWTTKAIYSGLVHFFIRRTGAMDPRRQLRHVAIARLVGTRRLLRLPIRVTILRWQYWCEHNIKRLPGSCITTLWLSISSISTTFFWIIKNDWYGIGTGSKTRHHRCLQSNRRDVINTHWNGFYFNRKEPNCGSRHIFCPSFAPFFLSFLKCFSGMHA